MSWALVHQVKQLVASFSQVSAQGSKQAIPPVILAPSLLKQVRLKKVRPRKLI